MNPCFDPRPRPRWKHQLPGRFTTTSLHWPRPWFFQTMAGSITLVARSLSQSAMSFQPLYCMAASDRATIHTHHQRNMTALTSARTPNNNPNRHLRNHYETYFLKKKNKQVPDTNPTIKQITAPSDKQHMTHQNKTGEPSSKTQSHMLFSFLQHKGSGSINVV